MKALPDLRNRPAAVPFRYDRAAWDRLLPAEGAIIYAQLEKDTSDPMSDHFGSRTERTVVLGVRTTKREDFRKLRAAAATFPETAHLGPGRGRYMVLASVVSSGWYYAQSPIHHKVFSTAEAADVAIAEATPIPDVTYQIHAEVIEHRDNHSMGAGNWLGYDRYSGWQVRSSRYFPGEFEIHDEVLRAIADGAPAVHSQDRAAVVWKALIDAEVIDEQPASTWRHVGENTFCNVTLRRGGEVVGKGLGSVNDGDDPDFFAWLRAVGEALRGGE